MTVSIAECRNYLRQRDQVRQARLDQRFAQAWHGFRAITEKAQILVLITEVEKAQAVLQHLDDFYSDYLRRIDHAKARLPEQAIVISDLMAIGIALSLCKRNTLSSSRSSTVS